MVIKTGSGGVVGVLEGDGMEAVVVVVGVGVMVVVVVVVDEEGAAAVVVVVEVVVEGGEGGDDDEEGGGDDGSAVVVQIEVGKVVEGESEEEGGVSIVVELISVPPLSPIGS